jgi:hypothetical protein
MLASPAATKKGPDTHASEVPGPKKEEMHTPSAGLPRSLNGCPGFPCATADLPGARRRSRARLDRGAVSRIARRD